MRLNVPSFVREDNDRAQEYERQGNHVEAARVYREAIARHPDVAVLHNNLGTCLANQQRWPEARTEFLRAIELTAANRATGLAVPDTYPSEPERNLRTVEALIEGDEFVPAPARAPQDPSVAAQSPLGAIFWGFGRLNVARLMGRRDVAGLLHSLQHRNAAVRGAASDALTTLGRSSATLAVAISARLISEELAHGDAIQQALASDILVGIGADCVSQLLAVRVLRASDSILQSRLDMVLTEIGRRDAAGFVDAIASHMSERPDGILVQHVMSVLRRVRSDLTIDAQAATVDRCLEWLASLGGV